MTYTLTNVSAINFFDNNSHLDFNTMVGLFVNVMENLKTDMSDKIENAHNSALIKEISDKLSKMEQSSQLQAKSIKTIEDKLNDVSSHIYNHMNGLLSSHIDSLSKNMRDIIKSNNGDSHERILDMINNNNSLFLSKIESMSNHPELKSIFTCEIGKIHDSISNETGRVLESLKNSEAGQLITGVNKVVEDKYSKLDAVIKSRLEGYFSNNSNMYSSLLQKIEQSNSTIDIVSAYFQKQTGSNSKGKQGESKLEVILSDLYPSAEIKNTSGLSNCGDFIVERKGKERILIDNKDYETPLPVKEVEKMIRDVEKNLCHGILISQNSGIAQKDNFEINIHNNKIIVYIHNAKYDGDKITLAINIIDYLEPIVISKRNNNKEETISSDVLLQINKEYQDLASQKMNLIESVKRTQQDIISQIHKLDLPVLTNYLNNKYANTGKTAFLCDICNSYSAKNAKALAAHKRCCVKNNNKIIKV